MKRFLITAVAAACLLLPTQALAGTARHHAPAPKTEVQKLRAQNAQLRILNANLRYRAYVATVARDQALAGLPAAIKAVPIKDFHNLVMVPAFAVFPCDTYSLTGGTRWSFTFNSSC